MALDKSIISFVKNPYSLENIVNLGHYLSDVNRGGLYLICEELLDMCSDEAIIRSFTNALSASTRLTEGSANHYLRMTNNPSKSIILDQMSLIEDYLMNRIPLVDNLHLYPFYQAVLLRSLTYFTDAITKYPSILDDHIVTLEMRLYIDYITSLSKTSLSLFKILCNNNFNSRFDTEIKKLYDAMTTANKNKLSYLLPANLISTIDADYIIKRLKKSNSYEEIYKQIRTYIENEDQRKGISLFMDLLFKLEDIQISGFLPYILKLRELFIECPLLDLYIKNLFTNKCFYYRAKGSDAISLDNYFNFFKISAEASAVDDFDELRLQKVYTLNDIYGNNLIKFILYDDNPCSYDYTNLIDTYQANYALNAMVNYADNNLYNFKAQIAEANKKIEDFKNSRLDRALLRAFDEIENKSLIEISGSLSDDMKINIDYSFDYLGRNEYHLSLRIGNVKSYSVQSPNKFLEAFSSEERIKYGKDLTFHHKIDNLNDNDKEIVGYLRSLHASYYKKYLKLDSSSVIHLFNLLKDRIISFNDKPYSLRLNVVEPKFKLDSSYALDFSLPYDEIIPCFNSYLALDTKNHVIDYISSTDKGLTDFVISFKNHSLKRVKKDFQERIYPLYANLIEVSDEIKPEFKSSELEINAYFDLDASLGIANRSSYMKDGVIIDESNIRSNTDRLKLKRYKEALYSFGFNELNIMKDEGDVIGFLKADLAKLKEICNVYLSDSILNKKIAIFTPPSLKMSFSNDLLNVFMKESSYTDEELHKILLAIKRKKKFVLLSGNRIIDLDNKESEDFFDTINDLNLDTKHLSEGENKPLYQTLIAFKHLNNIEMDSKLIELVNAIKGFKEHNPELPKLNVELRDYQIEGFSWLKILSSYHLGGILADDMGLGKTLEIITLLASDDTSMPSLIVTPKSLIFNWISEFNHFAPDYEIIPIYGGATDRDKIIANIDINKRAAYITSYDSLRIDNEKYKLKFNYLILDEAQYIKNALALTTKACRSVSSNNRFALTGTPIENDIFDLWSIFEFLMPGYLPGAERFKSNSNNEAFQDMIRRRVAPFILRRTKEDVLTELPDKFERVISADMTASQRKLYDAHCYNAREILNNGGKSFDVLHLLTRLRQICVDPRTFVDDFNEKSGKILLLRELIPEYIKEGHRILIFSQFVKALNLLELELKDLNISYMMITGDTKAKDRIDLVNEFNSNSSIKVFLISLKAGGNGLNLVGADTVIHLDPWWNLASENQATDRAYRMGQRKNVEVIRLIVADSIEQRVVELQYKKKDLIDKLISNDTKSIERISLEDMKFILE